MTEHSRRWLLDTLNSIGKKSKCKSLLTNILDLSNILSLVKLVGLKTAGWVKRLLRSHHSSMDEMYNSKPAQWPRFTGLARKVKASAVLLLLTSEKALLPELSEKQLYLAIHIRQWWRLMFARAENGGSKIVEELVWLFLCLFIYNKYFYFVAEFGYNTSFPYILTFSEYANQFRSFYSIMYIGPICCASDNEEV